MEDLKIENTKIDNNIEMVYNKEIVVPEYYIDRLCFI